MAHPRRVNRARLAFGADDPPQVGMRAKRYPRDRRGERQRQKIEAPVAAGRVRRSQTYGDIPLVRHTRVGPNGKLLEWWLPDPDYAPLLPPGAVRGDVRKQVFCTLCHEPKYFYLDETRTCVQCGQDFVFRATEQRYWYEQLKFIFDSVPIRCPACRRLRRTEQALAKQLEAARQRVTLAPDDPAAHLGLASALVLFHERTGRGSLNDAVAAARRAAGLWPDAAECLYWEGRAQLRAGRRGRARTSLAAFLAHGGPRSGTHAAWARLALAEKLHED